MKIYNYILVVLFLSLMSSCSKSIDDSEKPEIITFFLNTSAATPGGQISLNADVSDNNLLKSYKISVIDDFGYTADKAEETTRLNDVSVTEINDKQIYTINNYSLPIPLNVSAGPYIFKLSVLDDKGNESIEKKVSFEITNSTDQPTVNITTPTGSSTYNQGDTIYVAGTVSDNLALKEINLACKNSINTFYNSQFLFDTVITTSYDLASIGNVKIPVPNVNGNYTLTTNVKDTTGNLKRNIIEFSVN